MYLKYQSTLLRLLDLEFNKSKNVIQVIVRRKQKEFPYLIKCEVSDMILVKTEGVNSCMKIILEETI